MKVCFYGNTGHSFTAFLAGGRIPEVEFVGYCPSYPGESMERLLTFAGKSGSDYPDGWEIHRPFEANCRRAQIARVSGLGYDARRGETRYSGNRRTVYTAV